MKERPPHAHELSKRDFSEKEFKVLYAEYFEKVYAYNRSKVQHMELVNELTYDAFLKLWQQLKKGHRPKNVEAYLFTIVKNLLVDHYRSSANQKHQQVFLDSIPEMPNAAQNPEQEMLNDELKAVLDKSIRALSPQSAQVFNMIRVEGLKYSEVAEKLNISVNSVDTQLSRAVKKLRKSLKEYREQKVFLRKKAIDNLVVIGMLGIFSIFFETVVMNF